VRLTPVPHRGRVTAAGYSSIYWVRADGTVAEQRAIDENGRFTYDLTPTQEYAVLVGNAPLLVTRQFQTNADGELQIDPPAVPQRQLRVAIAESSTKDKAVIGLWVDGMRIPVSVLSAHQIARRQPWFARKQQPLALREIYAAQGLAVAIGPDVDFITTALDDPNLFAGQAPIPVTDSFTIQ
jgi:hypothetical protein